MVVVSTIAILQIDVGRRGVRDFLGHGREGAQSHPGGGGVDAEATSDRGAALNQAEGGAERHMMMASSSNGDKLKEWKQCRLSRQHEGFPLGRRGAMQLQSGVDGG